ncbi:hypothetical protein ABS71_12105 [bacterium SCN 62-11]|nr:hypothetical protein [Candidatus Eremiobacteraeota bacterium]ODT65633.1 MAG: hypothetical protein ABS71_12105 [bacterium SCN 62-11]
MLKRLRGWWGRFRLICELGPRAWWREWRRGGWPAAFLLAEEARWLRTSGLFQASWYADQGGESTGYWALSHYLQIGWREGRDPGPDFSTRLYLDHYPDVRAAGIHPAYHYLRWGQHEGRRTWPSSPSRGGGQQKARPVLTVEAAQERLARVERGPRWPRLAPGSEVLVLCHSQGNLFMGEIADLLCAGLVEAGWQARRGDESSLEGAPFGVQLMVVAPHEFFLLQREGRRVPLECADRAILCNVEQLHTSWFRQGLDALRRAPLVVDICLQSAATLVDRGLPAAFLPLGHVANYAALGTRARLPRLPALDGLEEEIRGWAGEWADRPLDIFFIGHKSGRRSEIFERLSERLARWRCHLVLSEADRPLVIGQNARLDTDASLGLAQRSKIILNLHQTEETFFEWHRIVCQGIWQGALVVSEPCAPQPYFLPGQHYIEAPLREMADVLDWLLGEAGGRETAERIRVQALARLRQEVVLSRFLQGLLA